MAETVAARRAGETASLVEKIRTKGFRPRTTPGKSGCPERNPWANLITPRWGATSASSSRPGRSPESATGTCWRCSHPGGTSWRSRRWWNGTGPWSGGSVRRSWAIITRPRTHSRPRSSSWPGRPDRSGGATHWRAGCTAWPFGSRRGPVPPRARRRELERNWAALRAVETQGGAESPDDLEALVHEEIGRLPERFRAPVVLCYLEGRTYEEAAQVLLCPVGTIKSRLATARDRLRRRLERRNLPMSSGSVGLALQGGLPMTTVPVPLPAPTLQAILRNANGGPTPASISHLTNGVLETMLWHRLFYRLGVAAAILIGTASLATGAIGLARRNRDVPADGEQQVAAPAPAVAQPNTTTIEPAPEDPLPAGAILRFGSPRFRQPTPIRSLAVSPDGKVAVTHGEFGVDSALRVYDLATGRAIRIIDTGRDGLGVAVSPDGKTLATMQYLGDKAVFLYDMTSRKETARIPFPTAASGGGGNILLFSPDGKHVVINTYDWNGLHLIGLAERRVIRTFPHTDVVFAAAFSPDGKHLVGGGYDVENEGVLRPAVGGGHGPGTGPPPVR